MAQYFVEPSMSGKELYAKEQKEYKDYNTESEPENDENCECPIGRREITGEFDKYMLLEEIKRHGMISVVADSSKTLDNFLNSVECLKAQIEYLQSNRR